MNATDILVFAGIVIVFLTQLVALVQSFRRSHKLAEIKISMNSRLDQLLNELGARKLSEGYAAGLVEGRIQIEVRHEEALRHATEAALKLKSEADTAATLLKEAADRAAAIMLP